MFTQSFDPVTVPAEAISAFQTSVLLSGVGVAITVIFLIVVAAMLWKISRSVARLEVIHNPDQASALAEAKQREPIR